MNIPAAQSDAVESYLNSLRHALGRLPEAQKQEIVAEIQSHVRERMSGSPPTSAVEDILGGLGTPERLAEQYRIDLDVESASTSHSPVKIFRAAKGLASRGWRGFSIFMIAVVGYGSSAGFYLTGLLKPLFHNQIGVWFGPNQFVIGLADKIKPGTRELSGEWFILLSLVAGLASLTLTTELLRSVFKKQAAEKMPALESR